MVHQGSSPVFSLGLLKFLGALLSYTSTYSSMMRSGVTTTTVTLFTTLLAQTIGIGFGVFMAISGLKLTREERNKLLPWKYVKILSLYMTIYQPLLLFPILNVSLTVLVCFPDSPAMKNNNITTCFKTEHIVLFPFAVLSLILATITSAYLFLFKRHLNPLAHDPCLSYQRVPVVLSICSKLTLALILSLKPSFVSFGLVPCFAVETIARGWYKLSRCSGLAGRVWGLYTAMFSLQSSSDLPSIAYYYVGLAVLLLFTKGFQYRARESLLENPYEKRDMHSTALVLELIRLIEGRRHEEAQVKLEGFFGRLAHQDSRFRSLMPRNKSVFDDSEQIDNPIGTMSWDDIDSDKKCYELLMLLIQDYLQSYPKNTDLKMISCYIYSLRLGNNYLCVYLSQNVLASKPGIYYESECQHLRSNIEQSFIVEDKIFAEQNGMNVTQIVTFHRLLDQLKQGLMETCTHYLRVWEELLSPRPSHAQVMLLSEGASEAVTYLHSLFHRLKTLSPDNVKTLCYFGSFKAKVLFSENEGRRYIELASHYAKSILRPKQDSEDMRFKYGENTDSAMICASGNQETFGLITSANQELQKCLGYEPAELIGKDVKATIPMSLAEIHSEIMVNYFETGKGTIVNRERLIYPLRQDGFITPINGLLRIMPNLELGIQMVVFMQPSQHPIFSDHSLILTDDKGILVGISKV